ncbi:hypothetical protein R6V09_31235 [Streptomyces sp. W16]|uniref:hypothetical protein n=1 Tax=Streptomyces sp. W16 TaxID=3076631 RepID=UPI00295B37F5|nr:hypothetical protein [Streptomyces sp. W16]MDV9174571.1 hypothetical protein [Streptomyces sp. W16]
MNVRHVRDLSEPAVEKEVVDIDEHGRLRELEEQAEDAWLNRLADEAEAEGLDGSLSLEEMTAVLRSRGA